MAKELQAAEIELMKLRKKKIEMELEKERKAMADDSSKVNHQKICHCFSFTQTRQLFRLVNQTRL